MELINELTNTARARARALPHRTFECSKQRANFADAIRGKETLDVIAEYKRASPSSGSISERNLAKQITAYEDGGAAAISVLTEPSYFKGSFDDLEDVVGFAGRAVALGDFRAGGDFPFELLDPAFGMAREMDMGEGADVQTQLFAVEQGRVALDHSRLLHVLDTAPTWSAREADLVRNLLHGPACVELQQAQDFL